MLHVVVSVIKMAKATVMSNNCAGRTLENSKIMATQQAKISGLESLLKSDYTRLQTEITDCQTEIRQLCEELEELRA